MRHTDLYAALGLDPKRKLPDAGLPPRWVNVASLGRSADSRDLSKMPNAYGAFAHTASAS